MYIIYIDGYDWKCMRKYTLNKVKSNGKSRDLSQCALAWLNHTSLITTNVCILKGSTLMNTDYLLECLRDLHSDPFFSLFILVLSVQLPVQVAWNTILSCIFHSSHLANCLNHVHWNIPQSVLLISRSGLQRIIWNVMAIKQNCLW